MQCDIDWFVWTRPVRSRCCPRHWSEKVPKTNCEENCQSCVRRVVGVRVQTMRSWIRTGAKMKVDLLDCVNKFNNLMIRSWRSGESQICGSHWRTIPLAKSSLAHIIGSASPSTLRTSTESSPLRSGVQSVTLLTSLLLTHFSSRSVSPRDRSRRRRPGA